MRTFDFQIMLRAVVEELRDRANIAVRTSLPESRHHGIQTSSTPRNNWKMAVNLRAGWGGWAG